MATDGVNYDGVMATVYDAGRELLPDADEAWRVSVAPYVSAGSVIVDVGAGTGRFARRFADSFDAQVIAVEPAAGMRRVGASSCPDTVGWAGGRAEALPLRSASADVIWLCCVVHYLDLHAAGAEFERVLRRGGTLLVRSVFPDRFDDLTWLRWFPRARAIDEERMPTVESVVNAWTTSSLRFERRVQSNHQAAVTLSDLADRLQHRAISTLELISDAEFEQGLAALRADAAREPDAPVYSPVDILVFTAPLGPRSS